VQLTLHSDYALRTLLYLGLHQGRPVPVGEVAGAYGISANHVAKVAQALVTNGFARARRGRTGGLELATPPAELTVGAVVRATEPTLDLLACFDRERSSRSGDRSSTACPITSACKLKRSLREARDAFLAVLDRTTLAELLENGPALARLLPLAGAAPVARGSRRG